MWSTVKTCYWGEEVSYLLMGHVFVISDERRMWPPGLLVNCFRHCHLSSSVFSPVRWMSRRMLMLGISYVVGWPPVQLSTHACWLLRMATVSDIQSTDMEQINTLQHWHVPESDLLMRLLGSHAQTTDRLQSSAVISPASSFFFRMNYCMYLCNSILSLFFEKLQVLCLPVFVLALPTPWLTRTEGSRLIYGI